MIEDRRESDDNAGSRRVVTFGLKQAIVVALLGIVVSVAVAVAYS